MPISLYNLSVISYLQTLGAMHGFLGRGSAHFEATGSDPDSVLDERLYGDMEPFKFQVWNSVHSSLGALNGLKAGVFGPPPPSPAGMDYAGLQKVVSNALQELQQFKADEIDALQGKDVRYELPSRNIVLPFTAEGFVLSFSLPNFYFHATTAYDILRHKGVPLGKRDFLGKMLLKS